MSLEHHPSKGQGKGSSRDQSRAAYRDRAGVKPVVVDLITAWAKLDVAPKTGQKLFKEHGVPVLTLSARKKCVRVADIERLIETLFDAAPTDSAA